MEGARKLVLSTLNGSYLSPKALEDLSFEFPLVDIEITENNQSVQIGYLLIHPLKISKYSIRMLSGSISASLGVIK